MLIQHLIWWKACRVNGVHIFADSRLCWQYQSISDVDSNGIDVSSNMYDERDDDDDLQLPDPLDGVVDDAVLRSALREQDSRIGFVFSKPSSHLKEEAEA
jgi:hypothetical protein